MATVALIVSLLIAWGSFAQKRKYQSDTLSAKFLSHLFEWSASLLFVLLIYHTLAFLLRSGWQGLTIAQLVRLEEWINTAKQLSDKYKPTWLMSLLVLFSLYFLAGYGYASLIRQRRFTPSKG